MPSCITVFNSFTTKVPIIQKPVHCFVSHGGVNLKFNVKHVMRYAIFVAFVEFKKREKHPWRSVTFSKVAG